MIWWKQWKKSFCCCCCVAEKLHIRRAKKKKIRSHNRTLSLTHTHTLQHHIHTHALKLEKVWKIIIKVEAVTLKGSNILFLIKIFTWKAHAVCNFICCRLFQFFISFALFLCLLSFYLVWLLFPLSFFLLLDLISVSSYQLWFCHSQFTQTHLSSVQTCSSHELDCILILKRFVILRFLFRGYINLRGRFFLSVRFASFPIARAQMNSLLLLNCFL